MMKGLDEDLNNADRQKSHKKKNNDDLDHLKVAEHNWQRNKQLNESILFTLYQGQFKSIVQSLTCHKVSDI